MNNPEIFVDRNFLWNSIDLCVCTGYQIIKWMKEPVFVKVEEGATPPVAIRLGYLEAQALMDRLWEVGLRPTEGSGSVGSLVDTERYFRDMQRDKKSAVYSLRNQTLSKDI